jgi:hypothetical protein
MTICEIEVWGAVSGVVALPPTVRAGDGPFPPGVPIRVSFTGAKDDSSSDGASAPWADWISIYPADLCCTLSNVQVYTGEQQIGGSGGSLEPPGPLLEPPGPLLTHLRTVCMAHSERLTTRLNPLAERTCFPQVYTADSWAYHASGDLGSGTVTVTPSTGTGTGDYTIILMVRPNIGYRVVVARASLAVVVRVDGRMSKKRKTKKKLNTKTN